MKALVDRLGEFLDAIEAASSMDDIAAIFLSELRRLGFSSFWILSAMIDPTDPNARGVALWSPDVAPWMQRIGGLSYFLIDPIQQAALRLGRPFYWRDEKLLNGLTPAQRAMIEDLSAFGLSEGLAIPINSPGRPPAYCAIFADEGEAARLRAALSLALFTHNRAWALLDAGAPPNGPRPTTRERACLLLAGRGKSDKEIAILLGLSERTVHHSIERAKNRLGVTTRMQAVIRAVHDREITTDELVG